MISLVVPTYNERQNIGELVKRAGKNLATCGNEYEMIIVDDNSPDGTANEVRRLQADRPWLKLVVRENERDLSTAVLAGWRVARGDILGCMDGDLQHPPEHLTRLIERQGATNADIVIASRYVDQGGVSDWKFHRRAISWTATMLAMLLLPPDMRRVRDPMSGFFILKRSVINGVLLKPLGYKILLEVLARGRYRWPEEVPYIFEERAHCGSKMGPAQIWFYLVHLSRLCIETGEIWRILKWIAIELAAIVLNVAALVWLDATGRLRLVPAAFVSAVLALQTKFIFKKLLTWNERAAMECALWRRFLGFPLVRAAGLLGNVAVVWLAAAVFDQPLVVAGLGGAVLAALFALLFSANPLGTFNPLGESNASAKTQRAITSGLSASKQAADPTSRYTAPKTHEL